MGSLAVLLMSMSLLTGAPESTTPENKLEVPEFCKDPDRARLGCALSPKLYGALQNCADRLYKLNIDYQKTKEQLSLAESKLFEYESIPEPEGLQLPTWLAITLPVVTAAAGAGVVFAVTR